ncbi:DUF1129 domain-containing protein [Rossellomorea aquimaris]|uniref:DUF1129 family protein n=1 Tax=Rossellomorea aquimaris TaxID=189382 RepID=UPI001CD39153|nr:DUF1129 family protein [Rossellomorea aquimaris]MCA1059899.1 DUF1129 domain-containing protein [Rossellomorea aquimaris]
MIEAKQLIELNNQKRTGLSEENEKYYSDFLIYMRLQLTLSEQQTEEVLMEILDHIIDGQREGKTARMILGDDPKAYADDIIEQLPLEKKRSIVTFVSSLALNLFGYFLLIRGLLLLIGPMFKEISNEVYPVTYSILALLIFFSSLMGVKIIFSIIKNSLFKEKQTPMKDSIKAGTMGMISTGIIICSIYFLPDIGPSFMFPWYASLISGALLLGLSYFLKK